MGHQDCVQQETPKVTSYSIPWAHVECGTLCGGTEWDSHGHPMRLRTDGNPIAFMDSQWQYWTLLDFVFWTTQPVTGHSLLYSHTSFRYIQYCQQDVHCLNLLVTNALHHVPDVLTYMEHIQNQSVFNFCAIPQVYSGFHIGIFVGGGKICMQKFFLLAHHTHLALRSSYWSIFPETFKLLNIIPVE